MNERSLNEGQWEDRKQWSLGAGQRKKVLKPICIYIEGVDRNGLVGNATRCGLERVEYEVQTTRAFKRNPSNSEILPNLPDRPWGPPSLLNKEY
jgi:hypothetical protein